MINYPEMEGEDYCQFVGICVIQFYHQMATLELDSVSILDGMLEPYL